MTCFYLETSNRHYNELFLLSCFRFVDIFQYVSSPQEVKPAPVEQNVDTQNVKAEHVEPQPVEHKA